MLDNPPERIGDCAEEFVQVQMRDQSVVDLQEQAQMLAIAHQLLRVVCLPVLNDGTQFRSRCTTGST